MSHVSRIMYHELLVAVKYSLKVKNNYENKNNIYKGDDMCVV
jgi:hypothetical protein